MKKFLYFLAGMIVVFWMLYLVVLPLNVEKYFSPVEALPSEEWLIAKRHPLSNLFVSDMHADTLLWHRSIAEKSELGHADIHRLRSASMGLQVFMSVIEAPKDVESDSIAQEGDQITPITILDKWPATTFDSYKQRALYQASKLYKAEVNSNGKLKVVLNREDLGASESWEAYQSPLFAILGLEGAHATEFDIANLDILFEAGYRSMELAHYSDTPFAGSSSGMVKYGLTKNGEKLIQRMNEIGMIIDVAHLSQKAIIDVLELTSKPVYSSHTGVFSKCPKARNLSDDLIKQIAEQGGIIGIGFFKDAICGESLSDLVESIVFVRDLVGAQHVALGSGWDVAPLAITPQQLPDLTRALLKQGLSEQEVRMIMGDNVLRFFLNNLPAKGT